ncbi:MAG: YdbL family protein [Desulfocapsa sp.]|nr:YdbL family protein [Desulfocapsa sp.]
MQKIVTTVFLTLLLLCQPVYGLELQDAKAQGLVGETTTGYLAPVGTPDQTVSDLITSINSKRKQHYQEIAKKNNTSLQTVEQLAGQTAIGKTPAGQFIDDGTGWKKK